MAEHAQAQAPRPDRAAILDALAAMFDPADVIELRAFPRGRKRTISGYFDGEHREALADAAVRLNAQGAAVYVTLNPVTSQLLGRCNNRVNDYAKATTSDHDITRRRWLLIDIDPVRPADISATDEQVAAAKEVAQRCLQYLRSNGWPEPLLGDSGNGAHLLVPLELANDDASRDLVKGALAGLAQRFDTAEVKVDQSVFNASRIVKAYGTVANKGDDTPLTPWRLSRLTSTSARGAVVTADQLRPLHPVIDESATTQQGQPLPGGFSLLDFLERLGIPYEQDRHNGSDRYKLAQCPFNPDHGKGEAAIFQRSNDAIGFKCQHNGCSDKRWQDVRELVDGPRETRYRAGATDADFDSADDEWPEPPPLGAHHKAPPPFPVDALPRAMRAIVSEAAASIQVPPDLPGCLALAALALAVGRRAEIDLGSGHIEPANLYVAVVQPPGARKSATFKTIMRPLNAWEAKQRQSFTKDHKDWEAKAIIANARLKDLERQAKKAHPGDLSSLEQDIRDQQAILDDEPTRPTLLTSNSTAEALVDLMERGDGVLGCFSAEGGQFFTGIGQYKGGANSDLDALLEAHSGDTIRNHRVLRGEHIVEHPCLTTALTIQPLVIQEVGKNREFVQRGLVARFVFGYPQDLVGQRRYADDIPEISSDARDHWKYLLERILLSEPNREDFTSDPVPWRITVGRDALVAWRVFAQDIEDRQAADGELVHVRDFASKLAGAVARIALDFHLATGDPKARIDQPVSKATMESAIKVGRYALAHFLCAFRFMAEDPRTPKAVRVLEWLRARAAKGEPLNIITAGDLVKNSVAGIATAAEAKDVLEYLAEEDWIRKIAQERKSTGRHRNPRFQIHSSVNRPVKPAKDPTGADDRAISPVLPGESRGVDFKTSYEQAMHPDTGADADYWRSVFAEAEAAQEREEVHQSWGLDL